MPVPRRCHCQHRANSISCLTALPSPALRFQAGDCAWQCSIGYFSSPGACAACPPLPSGAEWVGPEEVEFALCAYRCSAGLYGHPANPGVCVRCSVLQLLYSRAPSLPAHAKWADDLGQCDNTSWACDSGLIQVAVAGSPAACCPASVPHSLPAPARAPCAVACNAGYFWVDKSLACEPCPGTRPDYAAWGDNCSLVIDCGLYAVAAGWVKPVHAHWLPGPLEGATAVGGCKTGWACDGGYENNSGGLCCSIADTPGYGAAGGQWSSTDCSWRCKAGFFRAAGSTGPCVMCNVYLQQNFGIDYCQRCGERAPFSSSVVRSLSTYFISPVLLSRLPRRTYNSIGLRLKRPGHRLDCEKDPREVFHQREGFEAEAVEKYSLPASGLSDIANEEGRLCVAGEVGYDSDDDWG